MKFNIIPNSWFKNGWSAWHLVAAAIMGALGAMVTSDAWQDIWRIALKDEESSHIFLVPIVMGWLIWIRRRRLRQCRPHGNWIGPLMIVVGWGLYSLGDAQLIQSFWHGGAVLIVLGCIFSILGRDVFFQFLPAFAILIFLVPVPGRIRQRIAIPLGDATAQVTEQFLLLFNFEVQRMGSLLRINNVPVTIAEACNGLRMVFALTMVCFAFAFGTPLRGYVRLIVLAASPVSAIVCNVIRLVPTLWIYGSADRLVRFLRIEPDPGQSVEAAGIELANHFHDISGWIMLPIAFLLLMGIVRALRWALVPVHQYTLAYE